MSGRTLDHIRALGGQPFALRLEGWGFTGEAWARVEDGWISVRGALPGERILARLQPGQREGSRRLFADLVEVLEPSPERVKPGCGQAGYCRGCQLRAASPFAERRYKRDNLVEVVARYAGVAPEAQPVVEAIGSPIPRQGPQAAQRLRTTLSYSASGGLGLVSPGHEALVRMAACPALLSETRRLVARVEEVLGDLSPSRRPAARAQGAPGLAAVEVMHTGEAQGWVALRCEGDDEAGARKAWQSCGPLREKLAAALGPEVGRWSLLGRVRRHEGGPRTLELGLGPVRVLVEPGAWFHATREPARTLYEALPDWLDAGPGERLLDLGCGVGSVSLRMAPRVAQAVGVDQNLVAVELARQGAARWGWGDRVRFVASAWEKGLRGLVGEGARFEVACVNPMREPLGERALGMLNHLGVERLVYLGPSPVAAARDVSTLRELGWRLARLGLADLHPATYHQMAVVGLVRGA